VRHAASGLRYKSGPDLGTNRAPVRIFCGVIVEW
jgi:hypothetical protein